MKTLDDFITQKACEVSGMHPDEMRISQTPSESVQWWKEIAERYAAYMCKEQRKLCAEYSRLHFHDGFNKTGEQLKYFQSGADYLRVDKDSILNAPLATDK